MISLLIVLWIEVGCRVRIARLLVRVIGATTVVDDSTDIADVDVDVDEDEDEEDVDEAGDEAEDEDEEDRAQCAMRTKGTLPFHKPPGNKRMKVLYRNKLVIVW